MTVYVVNHASSLCGMQACCTYEPRENWSDWAGQSPPAHQLSKQSVRGHLPWPGPCDAFSTLQGVSRHLPSLRLACEDTSIRLEVAAVTLEAPPRWAWSGRELLRNGVSCLPGTPSTRCPRALPAAGVDSQNDDGNRRISGQKDLHPSRTRIYGRILLIHTRSAAAS